MANGDHGIVGFADLTTLSDQELTILERLLRSGDAGIGIGSEVLNNILSILPGAVTQEAGDIDLSATEQSIRDQVANLARQIRSERLITDPSGGAGGTTTTPTPAQPLTASQISTAISQNSIPSPNTNLTFPDSGTGTPVAAGMEQLLAEFSMLMQSTEAGRLQQGQNLQFADFFARLIGSNPVQAANFGAMLGFPGGDQFGPILAQLASGGAAQRFGGLPASLAGNVGGMPFDFPTSITGGQLAGIQANPALEQIVRQLANTVGDRSFLERNTRARIPAAAQLLPGVQI